MNLAANDDHNVQADDNDTDIKRSSFQLEQSLFEALLQEDYDDCLFLLNMGANPNHVFADVGGVSPLHIAVGSAHSHRELTELFLSYDANVNVQSEREQWTPMHVCCYWNKHESLRLLLAANADRSVCDKQGKTPLDVAVENASQECVRLLLDANTQATSAESGDGDESVLVWNDSHIHSSTFIVDRNDDNTDKKSSIHTTTRSGRSTKKKSTRDRGTQTRISSRSFQQTPLSATCTRMPTTVVDPAKIYCETFECDTNGDSNSHKQTQTIGKLCKLKDLPTPV